MILASECKLSFIKSRVINSGVNRIFDVKLRGDIMQKYTVTIQNFGTVQVMSEDAKAAVLCALLKLSLIRDLQEASITKATAKTASKANTQVRDAHGMVTLFSIKITPAPLRL